MLIFSGSYFADIIKMSLFLKNLPIPCVSFYYLVFFFFFKFLKITCWHDVGLEHDSPIVFPHPSRRPSTPPVLHILRLREHSTFLKISHGPYPRKPNKGGTGGGVEGRSRAFQFGTKCGMGTLAFLQLADFLCGHGKAWI